MIKTKLYQSISTLPMSNFITCVVDKNFNALIEKQGLIAPKYREFEDRWTDIYEDYAERMDDDSLKSYVVLMRQKIQLQTKMYAVSVIVEACAKRYNEEAVQVLKKLGFPYKFSKETYLKDLVRVTKSVKGLQIDLNKIEKEVAKFDKKEEIKREDFLDTLVVISKQVGYALKPEETTVESYIIHLNNLKKWQATQRK